MTLAEILHLIESYVGRRIDQDESLIESGLIDSVTLVELVLSIENSTGVQISVDDWVPAHFATAQSIYEFINKGVQPV